MTRVPLLRPSSVVVVAMLLGLLVPLPTAARAAGGSMLAAAAAPNAPTVITPADGATSVGTSPTLSVSVSDSQGQPMTVRFFAREYKSGTFAQIATNTGVPSGSSTSTSWPGRPFGERFEWYVTVAGSGGTTTGSVWTFTTVAGGDPVLIGAGDIAECGMQLVNAADTARVLSGVSGGVFALGDLAYPNGTAADFNNCYGPTWGVEKARTRPVAGNHDWINGNLNAYFGYFGASAMGPGGASYYSYDVGQYWHVTVLDSECKKIPGGGCADGSTQDRWLEGDLAANRSKNVIVMYHRPFRSSDNSTPTLRPFWDDLYAEGVDLVLDGHSHIYERLAPLTPAGTSDPQYGITAFTVGSGGESHAPVGTPLSSSRALDTSTYGVLKLTLHPSSFDWKFMGVTGATFTDAGTTPTHGRPGNATPVATPQSVSTPKDTAKTVTLAATDADGNPLSYRIASLPAHGQLHDGPAVSGTTLTAGASVTDASHRVTYVPSAGYTGGDAFGFTANDGSATSSPATVSITVSSPATNTAPAAQDVTTTATAGVPRTITLTGTDAENCELTLNGPSSLPSGATVSAPTNAACAGSGPFTDTATVTYTAPADLTGSDSFTYTVNDGTVDSTAATVSITVTAPPPNTAPAAQDVTTTATAGVPRTITLTGTDTENCELTFNGPATLPSGATVSAPTNAACTGTGPYQDTATVTYTTPADVTGPDSFTYTVNDGTVDSSSATVSITVTAPLPGVVFRSASVGANAVGNTVVVGVPAGVQAGDVMIAVIDVKAVPTVSTPAGWTLVSATSNASNFRQLVYSRVVTGPEPASYTWSINENRAASGAIAAYAGADTTALVQTFSAGTGTTAAITAPSVTSVRDGSMIVGGFGINADATISPPAGMTERGEIVSATRLRTELADYVLSPAGVTGTKTATAAAAAANIGQLIVVRPA